MKEMVFVVEELPNGGYSARGVTDCVFTEADSLEELHAAVREAADCHCDESERPGRIRLRFVRFLREETIEP
jgi:hypothetical protein